MRLPWRKPDPAAAGQTARPAVRRGDRLRAIVTPEGLVLPMTLASRGTRAGALALDLALMLVIAVLALTAIGRMAQGLGGLDKAAASTSGPMQLLFIVMVSLAFVLRNGWFLFWELGPRGATPAKRLLGIRVAARDGARLTAEMVIARNLLRDIELFLPVVFVAMAPSGEGGTVGWLAAGWFLLFALFPVFNRDRLRAGDLIAGTWVVETGAPRLAAALTAADPDAPIHPDEAYRFGEAELAIYGERELQTLERVLRENRAETMAEVATAICVRIGWTPPGHDAARRFLEAYYRQLRARLESGMRFGKRKADKFSSEG